MSLAHEIREIKERLDRIAERQRLLGVLRENLASVAGLVGDQVAATQALRIDVDSNFEALGMLQASMQEVLPDLVIGLTQLFVVVAANTDVINKILVEVQLDGPDPTAVTLTIQTGSVTEQTL